MKTIPPLLILTNRGHFVAYRTTEAGHLDTIESSEIFEGHEKLSDIVTDQAGAYSNVGGHGTSTYERMPLTNELEMRCFRQIAAKIHSTLDREKPFCWGLATPADMNGAVLQAIGEAYQKKLALNLRLDLTNSPPDEVAARFREAAHAF